MEHDPRPKKQYKSPRERAKTQVKSERKKILRQIKRARTRLLVCMLTLPVYVIAVWMLLNNQQNIDSFMFIYMGVWAVFAVDMARRRCPNCGEQYFVKVIFLNLLTRRCLHCGLTLDARDEDDEDSMDF